MVTGRLRAARRRIRSTTATNRRRFGQVLVRARGGSVGPLDEVSNLAVTLSLDVFDTCLGRAVWSPVDIFRLAAAAALGEPADAPAVIALTDARVAAEAEARRRSSERDVTLDQIYDVLAETYDTNVATALRESELATERSYSLARPDTLRGVNAAVAAGAQIDYLSDMYLSAAFIAELLENAGFPSAPVVVSSESGRCKADRSAFERHSSPGDAAVLHVGDNVRSDGIAALATGIGARIVDQATDVYRSAPSAYRVPIPPPLGDGILLAIAANTALAIDPATEDATTVAAWRAGATAFGPLIITFATHLIENTAPDAVTLFSSRDMSSTRDVYTALAPERRNHYVELSRRSLTLPALSGGIRDTDRDLLIGGRGLLTERELWNRIGLEPPNHRTDIDRPRSTLERDDVWDAFVADADRFTEHAALERDEFRSFWLRHQLPVDGNATLIDVGWRATVQHLLGRSLEASGFDVNLDGRYLALLDRPPDGTAAAGWLVDGGQPASVRRSFEAGIPLVELGLQADEGTVIGYRRGEAVRGPAVSSRAVQTTLQAAAATVAQQWLAHDPPAMPTSVSVRPLFRLLSRPTRAEALALGSMLHTDKLGASDHLTPVLPPPDAIRRTLLRRGGAAALRASEWRPGMLAAVGVPSPLGAAVDAGLRGLKGLGRVVVRVRPR